MVTPHKFSEFADLIKNLSYSGPTEDELEKFALPESDGRIRMYYAPFDWVNTGAKVVIVGITPGRFSMLNAHREAALALLEGCNYDESSKRAKRFGSFSNMRGVMAEMLDELGLPEALGIRGSLDLFGARYDLLHPTSCVRYPVFVWSHKEAEWVNYTGHSSKLVDHPTLLYYVEKVLADELRQVSNALVVPCGKAVDGALRHLASKSLVEPWRCLFGFPHASGANGHRARLFRENKEQLRQALAEWKRRPQCH